MLLASPACRPLTRRRMRRRRRNRPRQSSRRPCVHASSASQSPPARPPTFRYHLHLHRHCSIRLIWTRSQTLRTWRRTGWAVPCRRGLTWSRWLRLSSRRDCCCARLRTALRWMRRRYRTQTHRRCHRSRSRCRAMARAPRCLPATRRETQSCRCGPCGRQSLRFLFDQRQTSILHRIPTRSRPLIARTRPCRARGVQVQMAAGLDQVQPLRQKRSLRYDAKPSRFLSRTRTPNVNARMGGIGNGT